MINQAEKLKIAMLKRNITQTKLAELYGVCQSNLSAKFSSNNFRLSEFERLVEALGCKLEVIIRLPNGEAV